MDPAINFCSACGGTVEFGVPSGDRLPRHVCSRCGAIHYRNPRIVVGTLPVWQDRILLCRRAIEPRRGYWTLPAGFLENQETAAEGALRETAEEANARVELDELFTMISVPHVAQIHLLFRSRLLDLEFSPGEETLETALFAESEIPWANIAFPTIEMSLRFYFEDRSNGIFQFRCCDIRTSPMEKDPL